MMKAGALTYAIFVMVVAAILCTLMISLAFMNRSFFIHVDQNEVVRDNAYSGIAMATSINQIQDYDKWVDLYGEGHDSVRVKRRLWGPYRVLAAEAKTFGSIDKKTAIIGYENDKLQTTALWLTDHNRPLQLAGDALLKGKCFLPTKGADRAYVEGSNYKRAQLVYGSREDSKAQLLEPEKEVKEYWLDYLKHLFPSTDSVMGFAGLPYELEHSFLKNTILARSDRPVKLDGYHVKGNVIITSTVSIEVTKSTLLQDVILIAPKVKLADGVQGQLHVVASDSVILKEGVKLVYPSSIVMIARGNRLPYCLVSKGAALYGTILSFTGDIARSNNLALEIQKEGLVKGVVYCEDNFELGGLVEGSVICNRFLLATPSGIYENHILDGKIDRTSLPEDFATIGFKGMEQTAKTIAWLSY